ncbi:hypothetical protein OKW34_005519 [Paraburkholderia youngii]|uniref:hypothetical protein n=1 Tax=Paraburkholderia youngii TaxID=2782701 RepID=UPI003D2617F4
MKIFEIPQTTPLAVHRIIPEHDMRGFPYRDFKSMKPEDSKLGDAGYYVGVKATCVYHSQTERMALHFLDFNTRVLLFRTMLPYYDEEKFCRKYLNGDPIWRNEVSTIDIDILYEDDLLRLSPHGVSCKDTAVEFETDSGVRRSARDRAFYESINGTWEPVVKNYFPEIEYYNYVYIVKHIRRSNVFELNDEAQHIAQLWKKRGLKKPVAEYLEPFAKKLGTDRHQIFRLTCAAIYLGHLRLDHNYEFSTRTPLRLQPDGIYRFSQMKEMAPWGFRNE